MYRDVEDLDGAERFAEIVGLLLTGFLRSRAEKARKAAKKKCMPREGQLDYRAPERVTETGG